MEDNWQETGTIMCPLAKKQLDIGHCTSIVDVADGMIKESALSEKITDVPNWKDICKKCKWHEM